MRDSVWGSFVGPFCGAILGCVKAFGPTGRAQRDVDRYVKALYRQAIAVGCGQGWLRCEMFVFVTFAIQLE